MRSSFHFYFHSYRQALVALAIRQMQYEFLALRKSNNDRFPVNIPARQAVGVLLRDCR